MIIFRLRKKKIWHISTNARFSVCHNASMYKKGSDATIDSEYVEVVHDKSTITRDMKESLCKPCLMQAYEEGLIRVEFNNK